MVDGYLFFFFCDVMNVKCPTLITKRSQFFRFTKTGMALAPIITKNKLFGARYILIMQKTEIEPKPLKNCRLKLGHLHIVFIKPNGKINVLWFYVMGFVSILVLFSFFRHSAEFTKLFRFSIFQTNDKVCVERMDEEWCKKVLNHIYFRFRMWIANQALRIINIRKQNEIIIYSDGPGCKNDKQHNRRYISWHVDDRC